MRIKPLHENFKMPVYATPGSAAFDIHAVSDFWVTASGDVTIGLGFAAEVPEGHVALLAPRSGLGSKHGMRMLNTVGVIDSDYRGEWRATITANESIQFKPGDRILQCMILPVQQVNLVEVSELSETERGEGGYGSTGL